MRIKVSGANNHTSAPSLVAAENKVTSSALLYPLPSCKSMYGDNPCAVSVHIYGVIGAKCNGVMNFLRRKSYRAKNFRNL